MRTKTLTTSRAFRGTNFVTPVIVSLESGTLKSGARAHVELSHESPPYWSQTVERNPNGGPIWGVTVKHPDGCSFEPDLSRSFSGHTAQQDALDYIESL